MIEVGVLSLSGIAVALILVWLNHVLTNTREKAKERRAAGLAVVAAFRPELDALRQTGGDCRLILNDDTYRRHESDVRNFSPHLWWFKRILVRRAWHQLAHHPKDKEGHIPLYAQYADYGSLTTRRKVRPIVIGRIEKITSLARS